MTESPWLWIGFNLLVLLMLALDLGVLHRKAKAVSLKEAIAWSVIWVLVALVFNVWVHYAAQYGWVQFKSTSPALDYFTGYLIERALSIDNIFVFLMLFTYFGVAPQFQYRVLFWGILGALVMRGLMIWLGVELIERFSWILYLFGAFLVWTGWKLLFQKGGEVHPEHNPVLKVARKFLRVTATYRDQAFFVREGGRWYATPMFLVLLVVETTDVAFALDSIPAIFAITQDPFIIYSSNVFAILGLRALYFLLAGVMPFFRFLNMGLAFVLMFIGVKMLLETAKLAHISTATSLGVVGGVLGMAVAASVIATKAEQNAQRRAAAVGNGASSGPSPAGDITTDLAQQIEGLASPAESVRQQMAIGLYCAGHALGDAATGKWRQDPEFASLLTGMPTVGVAVHPERFAQIRRAWGNPPLADVPPEQDAQEFELEVHAPGAEHAVVALLDILTTRTPDPAGPIRKFLDKFGEGIQQVEYLVSEVERATAILRDRFGARPIYPQARPGAGGSRMNFILASTPDGRRVLIELVEKS